MGFVDSSVVKYPLAISGCGLLMVHGEAANVEARWEGPHSGFWISSSSFLPEAMGKKMAVTLSMYAAQSTH